MVKGKISAQDEEHFRIGIFQDNLEKSTWHYHNHYEISFITEGTGKRIVADSMESFHPGDLVFIGQNLPHVWIADKARFALSNRNLEMVYLQFSTVILFPELLSMPEFANVRKALEMSERGIQIVGDTLNKVSEIMLQLPYLNGIEQLLNFYRLMDIIGKSTSNIGLASEEYLRKKFNTSNKRIEAIHDYFMNNYRNEVNLEELSQLINMAKGSLCRFFKENSGITLWEYLNHIKIEFACKMLMNNELSIAQVCFDSGFNNLNHFNKQFRKITGITPSSYRKKFSELP
ncbi:MAG TPA: AraC family transcriptional regulator [Prolixibacteraceae bacterium]|nr:AraC family transcriptional regulator [Prolixibacteraceae bacterium]